MQSKTNLELKHFCEDFVPLRKILKELGAQRQEVKKQKDYFFNLPKRSGVPARLKIRLENSTQTAVYYTRPAFGDKKGTVAEVKLYSIKDKDLLPYLEQVLGVFSVVEKTRELWKKGNTVFNLDTVKGVGNVFEIELQKIGKLTAEDEKTFAEYKKQLLPYLGKVIKGSNADLAKR